MKSGFCVKIVNLATFSGFTFSTATSQANTCLICKTTPPNKNKIEHIISIIYSVSGRISVNLSVKKVQDSKMIGVIYFVLFPKTLIEIRLDIYTIARNKQYIYTLQAMIAFIVSEKIFIKGISVI